MSDWKRIESIFDQLVELAPAARSEALERLCGGDVQLRREVEEMLASMEQAGPLDLSLDGAIGQAMGDLERESADASPVGRRVGRWQIVGVLGEGGMGRVFRVRRADGAFEQEGALKILRWELATPALQAQFEAERQILARLRHPSLARLLDGGVTDDGLPFLVMEAIDGVPIDRFCAERDLSIRQRVRLMAVVARAVGAAHRQLVVHRDLKPSNLLIQPDGEPRLVDFGIAKLLGELDSELTRLGASPYTPRYAAPEQIAGEPTSPASDVFSLGVLLYELLTGTAPTEAPPTRYTLPAPPSRRLRSADSPRRAQWRQLDGDLDAIVLKALREDPAERYDFATSLADDLDRWLARRPVEARAPSALYVARKLIARHRLLSALVAALAAVTLVGVLGIWRQVEVANTARARAERLAELSFDVLRLGNPDESGDGVVTARELLEAGRDRARAIEDPLLRSRLLEVVAEGLASLRVFDQAAELFQEGAEVLGYPGRREGRVPYLLEAAGLALGEGGEPERAEALLVEAQSAFEALRGGESEESARLLYGRAFVVARNTARTELSGTPVEEWLLQALDILARRVPEGNRVTADALHLLAQTEIARYTSGDQRDQDLKERALRRFEEGLALRRRLFGERSIEVADALNDYALVLGDLVAAQRAIVQLEESLAIYREAGRSSHPTALQMAGNLAYYLRESGELEAARAQYEELVEAWRVADLKPPVAIRFGLAKTLLAMGRVAAAQPLLSGVLADVPREHNRWCVVASATGEALLRQGNREEARPLLAGAVERCRVVFGPRAAETREAEGLLESLASDGAETAPPVRDQRTK